MIIGCPGSEFASFDDSKNLENCVVGSKMLGNYSLYSSPPVSGNLNQEII